MGTNKENEASIFYIEKQVCPGEFSIAYYGEQVSGATKKKISKYLTTNSKLTGNEAGPLKIEGGRPTKFTLRHPIRRSNDISIEFWESDACYVRLAPRKMQKKSYLGFNGFSNTTMCVCSRKEEGENISMRFSLSRVGIEQCKYLSHQVQADSEGGLQSESQALPVNTEGPNEDVFGELEIVTQEYSQFLSQKQPESESEEKPNGDSDEDTSDFDFEYEFDQISDSDDD